MQAKIKNIFLDVFPGLGHNAYMDKTLGWIGCIGGILGAFAVANEYRAGYIPFLIGAVAYCVVAYRRGDSPLLLLNIVFAVANLNGLFNWIAK